MKSESIKILDIQELCFAILDELENARIKYNVEDLRTTSQNVWNGLLTCVCNAVVKPNKAVIYNYPLERYKIDIIDQLCDFYINLCEINEKEVSIIGFSKLSGIHTDTINEWASNNYIYNYVDSITGENISINPIVVHKKLITSREESLSNMLISGKRNPVGILGALNHRYGWNTQNQVVEVRQTALVERSSLGIGTTAQEQAEIVPPGTENKQ